MLCLVVKKKKKKNWVEKKGGENSYPLLGSGKKTTEKGKGRGKLRWDSHENFPAYIGWKMGGKWGI